MEVSEHTLTTRALAALDLPAVLAIDCAIEQRSRGRYVERRLAAALREPQLHAQLAARTEHGLVGYVLARVLVGEFGRNVPALRLEMIGVHPAAQGRGVARQLFAALRAWASKHGVHELRTAASWRDPRMLHWLAQAGFKLAPNVVLERKVAPALARQSDTGTLTLEPGEGPGGEVNFGHVEGNDHERLSRGHAQVQVMQDADLREIVRVDRCITGHERSDYIAGRLHEALDDAGVRVSLTARLDGAIVGYLMARADLGDFGRPDAVAVIDTLGVDPDYVRHGVGHALLDQLDAQLDALRIERVETVVALQEGELLRFFLNESFSVAQRLALVQPVEL